MSSCGALLMARTSSGGQWIPGGGRKLDLLSSKNKKNKKPSTENQSHTSTRSSLSVATIMLSSKLVACPVLMVRCKL